MKKQISKLKKTEIHTRVKGDNSKKISKKSVFNNPEKDMPIEFLVTGIPIGYPVNSVVPANTAVQMPNAQVYGDSNVPLCYLDGSEVPGGYASPGNDIKILEIFEGMLLVLVPVGSGAEGDGQWVIGYMETSVLGNTVWINANTITWNSSNDIPVYDANDNLIYTLPATQAVQFLYETPNNDYMCILFNNNSAGGELQTGYVPAYSGTFYRYDYLPSSPYAQTPGIMGGDAPNSPYNAGHDDSLSTALIQYDHYLTTIGMTENTSWSYTYSQGCVNVNAAVTLISTLNNQAAFQYTLNNGVLSTVSGTVINNSDFEKFNITINGQNLIQGILTFTYGDFGISWSSANSITLTFKKQIADGQGNTSQALQLSITISFNDLPPQTSEQVSQVQYAANNYGEEELIVCSVVFLAVALGPEAIPAAIAAVAPALINRG